MDVYFGLVESTKLRCYLDSSKSQLRLAVWISFPTQMLFEQRKKY